MVKGDGAGRHLRPKRHPQSTRALHREAEFSATRIAFLIAAKL